jgi:hypothetical protein
MSSRVRLAMGEGKAFAAYLFALSALVALLAGSVALRNVIPSALPSNLGGGAALLEATFLGEVDSLLSAWLTPLWALTAASAFVVSLESARSFDSTSTLLSELGADESTLSSLLLTRGALLASLSFVIGLSVGAVASQVVFRAFLVFLGAQYYVPEVPPEALAFIALLALSALAAGFGAAALAGRRRKG